MVVRQRRQLGQMGDAQHLFVGGDAFQLLGDLLGGPTGNAGVHLVENQGLHLVFFRQNVLHGQHDSRQLAAGGHLAHGLQGFARVGGHVKRHGVRAGYSQLRLPELAGKLHPGHVQLGQLRQDALRHGLRRRFPVFPEGDRRVPCGSFRLLELPFQPFQMVVGKFDVVQLFSRAVQIRKDILTGRAVLPAQLVNDVQPGLDLFQLVGGIA